MDDLQMHLHNHWLDARDSGPESSHALRLDDNN